MPRNQTVFFPGSAMSAMPKLFADAATPAPLAATSATPAEGILYRPETAADEAAIEAIHEVAFGPGRFARTAFRLREGVAQDPHLSLVAELDGAVVGSVRLTPIRIGETPALLLGPLAVRPDLKSRGIGTALMRRSMEEARVRGHRLVLLVGDLPYYWPFGFRVVKPGSVEMPGPVDPGRLLVAELIAGAADGVHGPARGGA
ncbi:acetyltransferase GNAT family protein [Pleomorphomonas sp. SM30]|uniref:Putative N-acetyltransferase YhbS n=2 Tax=Oharaeibacter diazotrophicus TaxID=1920512 RepID=A0A4R6RBP9_9HYPH|nr:putative N-acetyltransferase YhbS [Oharaeibacter diazotrophicus]BBE72393.1 acetyltransferase GNAT family protein [Pleomorphomonas sp. SM30]GLS79164.1 N-acetyltransferase [Oharaeibacter diazotrophicus]